MNAARPSTSEQRQALKIATKIVVNLCAGPKQAAKLTAVDETTLSLNAAIHDENRFMRIDVALDLDHAAGDPVITRALAAAQGFSLVRDEIEAETARLSLADYGRLQRQAFEAQAVVFESLEDGAISPSEKRAILRELAELRQAIALVESKVEGA